MAIRDRIKELRRVPARQLRPHPANWRTHPPGQRAALEAVLRDVGYAGALLARELADGTLQLIDGHLRAATTPDELVPVLVLDVDEAEAGVLLATFDPLGSLAGQDEAAWHALLAQVGDDCQAVEALLAADQHAAPTDQDAPRAPPSLELHRLFQLVVDCGDEARQRELFEQLRAEGWSCRVLTL